MTLLPDALIEKIDNFFIVRDDRLDGGTKRRALDKYLPMLKADHFIYTGSVYGSGGWALAEACRDLGFSCTLALSKSDYAPEWLDRVDCDIVWHEPAPVKTIHAAYAEHRGVLPPGFDDPLFKRCLADILCHSVDFSPSEIWVPCVSGVMAGAAQLAWPDRSVNAVCMARHHGDLGAAKKYQAPGKYHRPALNLPPYPANPFSDAKLWQFAARFALKDALIWNTSR